MKAIPLDVDEELKVREPTSLSLRELLGIAFREWRDRPPKPRTDIIERGFMLCDNTPPPKSQPHPPSPPLTGVPKCG